MPRDINTVRASWSFNVVDSITSFALRKYFDCPSLNEIRLANMDQWIPSIYMEILIQQYITVWIDISFPGTVNQWLEVYMKWRLRINACKPCFVMSYGPMAPFSHTVYIRSLWNVAVWDQKLSFRETHFESLVCKIFVMIFTACYECAYYVLEWIGNPSCY